MRRSASHLPNQSTPRVSSPTAAHSGRPVVSYSENNVLRTIHKRNMSLELALIIGGLLGSFTICATKIIHQIQNSKCISIRCCGSECLRDVNINLDEVDTSDVQRTASPPPPPQPPSSPVPPAPRPRPRLNVTDLRDRFERI